MIRIDKYLTQEGVCSRREAKAYIARGWIFCNGKKVSSGGEFIDPSHDEVTLSKGATAAKKAKETVLVYKPRGYACTPDDVSGKTIFDVFSQFKHLNTVGRLDKESQGLILLSNDGLVTKLVTGKEHVTEKEYRVEVREDVLPWMIEKMQSGIKLKDGWTLPAKAERVSQHVFKITLKEGRKHQIRRMANELRLTINKLERVRIAKLTKKTMGGKKWIKLTPRQVSGLKMEA